MLNSIILCGRLTADPVAVGEKGTYKFSLAFDNPIKEANGDRGTSFINCVAFSKVGELVAKHLHKGSKVGVQGTIQQKTWLDKSGAKRSDFQMSVDTLEFFDKAPSSTDDVNEAPESKEAHALDDEIKPTNGVKEPSFDPYTGKPIAKK